MRYTLKAVNEDMKTFMYDNFLSNRGTDTFGFLSHPVRPKTLIGEKCEVMGWVEGVDYVTEKIDD